MERRREDVSTFPPKDTFNQDAETVARVMSSKKVSPKGIGSGLRMIQFFINRAGKNLSKERKSELKKAQEIMRAKVTRDKPTSGKRARVK